MSGVYTFFGKENRADWNKVFEGLVNRGLKRDLVIVSDDLPGIIETAKAVYPYADHQLCLVHLQRNIRKYMTKADASEFNKELNKIKFSSSFDEAAEKFHDLCTRFKERYSRYMNLLISLCTILYILLSHFVYIIYILSLTLAKLLALTKCHFKSLPKSFYNLTTEQQQPQILLTLEQDHAS